MPTFPTTFNLDDLNGANGFTISGIDAQDRSGSSVAGIGDFNGDGFDDVIIGAPAAGPSLGLLNFGESYVVFGGPGGFETGFTVAGLNGFNGFRVDGIVPLDRSGQSVAGAGDINGDGFADIIIGAPSADPNGNDGAGESYVVFGSAGGFAPVFGLNSLNGVNGFRLQGEAPDDISGFSVSGAGDVNGDGFDDLIIGARDADPDGENSAGASYVVFGRDAGFPASLPLTDVDGTNGFRINGAFSGDRSGGAVSAAGDVNGDGIDDLIIGATGVDRDGELNQGASYVVFGNTVGFGSEFDLTSLDGTNGFAVFGIDAGDSSGHAVSRAGDVNGDGFDDVLIGAERAGNNARAGETYLVFGSGSGLSSALSLAALDGNNGLIFLGDNTNDQSGWSVAAAGDINSDGFDDILIGARNGQTGTENDPTTDQGESYVFFGGDEGFNRIINLRDFDGSNGFKIVGATTNERSGSSVSGIGDFNGDGRDDLIVGAPFAKVGGLASVGASYIFFGPSPSGLQPIFGTLEGDTLTGNGDPESFDLLEGNDSLDAGGGADEAVGGEGDDTLNGQADNDRLFGGGGNDRLSGGTGNDLLDGGNLRDLLLGNDGNDTLFGGEKADTLDGGIGDDSLNGGDGFNLMEGGAGLDTLTGTGTRDRMFGGDDNDTILATTRGNHVLDGGDGADQLTGTTGNELFRGGGGNDTITADRGNDRMFGGAGSDTLIGDPGKDRMFGGHGMDWLEGGFGDDLLRGDQSADTLIGGVGDDRLFGGSQADTFIFDVGMDFDLIADLEDDIDKVQLSSALAGGRTAQQVVDDLAIQVSSNRIDIDFGNGDVLKIVDTMGIARTDLVNDIDIV